MSSVSFFGCAPISLLCCTLVSLFCRAGLTCYGFPKLPEPVNECIGLSRQLNGVVVARDGLVQ